MKTVRSFLHNHLPRQMVLWLHKARSMATAARFGFPARGMLVIGVTGTKGKTTTCHFIASILKEAGYTVGMISTVDYQIGDVVEVNNTNMSNLPVAKLQAILKRMRLARCNALVMEVTSIGLDQYRVWGIPFRYVGFTNLTHDHLDYHKTWAHYEQSKQRLFRWPGLRAVAVNADDAAAPHFLEATKAKTRWSFSTERPTALPAATDHLWADKVSSNPGGASFLLTHEEEQARVRLQVPGRFNVENALCAAALCLNLNLKLGTIVAGLEKMAPVAGRLERIETKKGFSVMVDYAHTPDSLEKLYSTLRPDVRGRMIAVLGSCGDRDKTKRPIMGALAARFCDYVFVTDEEPYSEDPLEIIEEVAKGVPRGRALFKSSMRVHREERPILKKDNESGEGEWWWKVAERREAISRAIDLCKLDDLVLVTGMGAQNFRVVGSHKMPWNDRQVIEALLKEKKLL